MNEELLFFMYDLLVTMKHKILVEKENTEKQLLSIAYI